MIKIVEISNYRDKKKRTVVMDTFKKLLNKLPFKVNPYVMIVVILASIIVFSLAVRRSQDATFDAFIEAYVAGDAEGIVKLMPKEYISLLIATDEIDCKEDLVEGIQQMLAYRWKNYNSDEKKTYDYTIAYRFETADGDSNIDIINLKTDLGKYAKIKEICIIGFDPVIQAEWDDGETYEKQLMREDVSLVKIGQSWYVTDFSDLSNWI